MPDARLVVIPEAAHFALNEKPGDYLSELRRFFAGIDAATEGQP
jgi:pimeloyl-ACP methyl ester carboxylesterase